MGRKLAICLAGLALTIAYFVLYPEEHFDPEVLRGKSVLVTGASSGIGEQMAYYYAKHGANLLITARRENLLQKVTKKCKFMAGPGVTIAYIKADMSNMQEARGVVKRAFDVLGGIDHLVLNHAFLPGIRRWQHTPENITLLKRAMDVNLNSFIEMTSLAWHQLNERNGTLTVVSSIAGKLPSANMLPYSTSKHAMQGFYEGLQRELKKDGSNASITIAPLGPVGTDTAKDLFQTLARMYKLNADQLSDYFPMGEPAECAYQIIRASVLRKKELYFPRFISSDVSYYLSRYFPGLLDAIMKVRS